jgi:tRNA (cmo5U34)-methyltransferase
MLDQARRTLGALAPRAALHQGYIDDAPEGPFDAACCLLTLHFVPLEQRLPTLKAVRRRLRPGAPFVVAHHSFPQDKAGKARWLSRYAAFAVSSGVPPDDARRAADAIAQRLPAVSPSRDGALLLEAGFKDVELFYCAFTFRGWVATA